MSAPSERGARFERPRQFVRNRLSPQKTLGLHVTIGVLVMVLGAWSFSEIAEEIGPATPQVAFDQQLAGWFNRQAHPTLTTAAQAISLLGSVAFLSAISVCLGIYFAVRSRWNRFVALALTMLGGSLLNIVLKHFFQRQRPVLENPLVTLTSFAFPSGHTMGATLLYGILTLIALRFVKTPWQRVALIVTAISLIALIGLTRIYLGAHFLTDVLAAFAIGSAWLAFAWTTAETFRMRRQNAARQSEASRTLL